MKNNQYTSTGIKIQLSCGCCSSNIERVVWKNNTNGRFFVKMDGDKCYLHPSRPNKSFDADILRVTFTNGAYLYDADGNMLKMYDDAIEYLDSVLAAK